MNTWHDGPPDPAYLPLSDPLAPLPAVAPGGVSAATPARAPGALEAARPPRTLAALIKQIVTAPTEEDARRIACDGLRAVLRCRGVALRLLDDATAPRGVLSDGAARWPDASFAGDTVDDAKTHIPVLADQQVIGSLILDRGTNSRSLAPGGRALAEAVAQVLAQRLAHLRLLEDAADAAHPSVPGRLADRSPSADARVETGRDQFLNAVAHALRTPLTSVSGYAQLLRRGLDRAEAASAGDPAAHVRACGQLDALMRQAARMNTLLRDMLDVARGDAWRLPAHPGSLDMTAVVMEVIASIRAASPRHPITLRAPRMLLVRGDGTDIARIVRHLLENAVNFSPAGGAICLTLRQDRHADGTGRCVLRVRDHGIGISAGMEEAIFTPAAWRDQADARHLTGIGLGLRLSRALAVRHGGTLRAVPGSRVGAAFELCLPVAGPDGRAASTSLATAP